MKRGARLLSSHLCRFNLDVLSAVRFGNARHAEKVRAALRTRISKFASGALEAVSNLIAVSY